MITLEQHFGITVLRDDLLPGGTKSVFLPQVIDHRDEYVYATPVYGGFQIALSAYCQAHGKRATLFCAKRNVQHNNTMLCASYGAKIIEVPMGYLSVVEKYARDYCATTGAKKIEFGGHTEENKDILAARVRDVIAAIGREPAEVWCAVGSGTLVESILMGTNTATVTGVQVGKDYAIPHPRLQLMKYHRSFDNISKFPSPFPCMPNYDLKALEYCIQYKQSKDVLFWNVL